MTKKDYQLIADAIVEANMSAEDRWQLTTVLIHKLLMDNPRFDGKRFRAACERVPSNA